MTAILAFFLAVKYLQAECLNYSLPLHIKYLSCVWRPRLVFLAVRYIYTKSFSFRKNKENKEIRLWNLKSLVFSWMSFHFIWGFVNKKGGGKKRKENRIPINTSVHRKSIQNKTCWSYQLQLGRWCKKASVPLSGYLQYDERTALASHPAQG